MNGRYVKRNLVWYDGHRWYDAVGPNVVKVLEDFQYTGVSLVAGGGASTIIGGWTLTNVEGGGGDTVAAQIADGLGGILQITTDAAENDGLNMQVNGESFTFNAAYHTYFGCRFKLNADATQCDFLAGLCITDTDLLGGMTEGVYFRKVDGSTTVNFVLEEGSAETVTAYGTALAADTWYTVEFYYDGGTMFWYVNGVRQTSPVLTNLPNGAAVFLTPSIHFLSGEGNANVCEIDWIRAIQIQA
jgi:hypothetical protein